MKHHKRIVLDYDDTLSFAVNRDWLNAEPNRPLIKKTNKLYDDGWIVDVYTARGSLSCSSRQEADEKYREDMEIWLNKHGVKYHNLSFDKPLAAYYIDDKSVTPEQFLEIDIRPLQGGLTGADIFTDGKYVHKTAENSHEVNQWFSEVQGIVNVPKVERIVGNTITMEYIDHNKLFFAENQYLALGLIQDTLEKLKTIKTEFTTSTFKDYADRINEHCSLAGSPFMFKQIVYRLAEMNLKKTFSHGDFGITNLLFKDKSLYLIDPIPSVFGCTELDSAKLVASLYINEYSTQQRKTTLEAMALYNRMPLDKFKTLVCSEIIRVYKYHPDKQFIMDCVEKCF